MVNGEVIAYSIASFTCALFVLEFGADKFIDHTVIVAERTGIPQGVIALLTAGAEWEELAVVVISIARHRPSLAIGNIVGSNISNILGAFSLGLLFHKKDGDGVVYDRSSKIYSLLLLVLTALISGLLLGHHILWRAVGAVAIAIFALYVSSIGWVIYKGYVSAPELSDSDSDSDESSGQTADQDVRRSTAHPIVTANHGHEDEIAVDGEQQSLGTNAAQPQTVHQGSPTIAPSHLTTSSGTSNEHRLIYHVGFLTFGILAVILSAYVLSHAASVLVSQWGISDVLVGVVILSIATTIPEKFIAVVSGSRGQMGIMVANTVGSNIFLLSLCMGILWVSTGGVYNKGTVKPAEIGAMLGSALAMNVAVWFGAKYARPIGAVMLAGYIAFLVMEFTVIHRV